MNNSYKVLSTINSYTTTDIVYNKNIKVIIFLWSNMTSNLIGNEPSLCCASFLSTQSSTISGCINGRTVGDGRGVGISESGFGIGNGGSTVIGGSTVSPSLLPSDSGSDSSCIML